MARKQQAAPQVVNPAPNYNPQPPQEWQPPTPGGSVTQTYAPNGQVPFTAPPPRGPSNPFINAQWLWANGNQKSPHREVSGTITGVREAVGGNPAIKPRPGFFLDIVLDNDQAVTARVGTGDTRHVKLYDKFGPNLVNQKIVIRLSNPGDQTKAPWTID